MDLLNKIKEKKVYILLGVLALIVVSVLLFHSSITGGEFENEPSLKTVKEFAEETKGKVHYDNGIKISVPKGVIEYLLAESISKSFEADVNSLYIDDASGDLYLNLQKGNLKVPLVYSLEDLFNEKGLIKLSNPRFGKNQKKIPTFAENIYKKWLGIKSDSIMLDIDLPAGFELVSFNLKGEAEVRIDENTFKNLNTKLNKGSSKDVDSYYIDSNENELVDVLEKYGRFDGNTNNALISAFIHDKNLIFDYLSLSDIEDSERFKSYLSEFGIECDKEKVSQRRRVLAGRAQDKNIAKIFKAFDEQFKEHRLSINMGNPYDLDEFKTYDIKSLADKYDLGISSGDIDKFFFIYDDQYKVVYKLNDEFYYVRAVDNFEIVDASKIPETMIYEVPKLVDNKDDWEGVVSVLDNKFGKVFVRYMSYSDNYYCCVFSTADDPQEYSTAIFEKKDKDFIIVEENVKSIEEFLTKHKDINAEIIPSEAITSTFKRINRDTYDAILDEMFIRGYISNLKNTKIVYSSYDGNSYISFMLSDGREFVFFVEQTVFGTYLATVYPKEKAITNWTDINGLILLQDPPK